MSGLPSGFLVSAWKAAPDAPRAAPIVTAHSARASRRSNTTKSVAEVPRPVNAASTSLAGSGKSPMKADAVRTANTATASAMVATNGRRVTRILNGPARSAPPLGPAKAVGLVPRAVTAGPPGDGEPSG